MLHPLYPPATRAWVTALQASVVQTKQNKSNQIESNQIKSNQIKSNQIKSNQIKSNQIKSNQIKSNRIESNQNKNNTIQYKTKQNKTKDGCMHSALPWLFSVRSSERVPCSMPSINFFMCLCRGSTLPRVNFAKGHLARVHVMRKGG